MKNKLVIVYILCSLIFGVFCIGGFGILSLIKNHTEPKDQFFCAVVYPDNYEKTILINENIIFKQRCSACHKADKWLLGPPLAEVAKKRDPEWVFKWLTDKESLYAANDSIAIRLRDDDHNLICPPHRDLSMEKIQDLLNSLNELY